MNRAKELEETIRKIISGQEILCIVLTLLTFLQLAYDKTRFVLYIIVWIITVTTLYIGYKVRKKAKEAKTENAK